MNLKRQLVIPLILLFCIGLVFGASQVQKDSSPLVTNKIVIKTGSDMQGMNYAHKGMYAKKSMYTHKSKAKRYYKHGEKLQSSKGMYYSKRYSHKWFAAKIIGKLIAGIIFVGLGALIWLWVVKLYRELYGKEYKKYKKYRNPNKRHQ